MTIKEIAKELRVADKNKMAIAPIRDYLNNNDILSAYKIQDINTQFKIDSGKKNVGKKIGLTSKSVQKQLGVNQPDFGILFDDMQVINKGSIPWSEMMQPKVEAEVAFVLKKNITTVKPSLQDIENAIDYAVASLEIVDSRIKDWNIKILDTVADNASASHFVLGNNKKKLSKIDIVNCKMMMKVNNVEVSRGEGKACLGSPLIAVQWLAEQMFSLGNPLKAGDIILSGALGPMANVNYGDKIKATIDGLGSVSVNFIN